MFNVRLQAQWFCELLQQGDAAEAFNVIPESVVKDMASWLSFCIRMGRAGLHIHYVPRLMFHVSRKHLC